MAVVVGRKVKNIKMDLGHETLTELKEFSGQNVIIYFYPKDNTSGCTRQAIGFSENIKKFKKLNTTIIGISKDTSKSHEKFIEKHDLKILLAADPELELCNYFDIIAEKSMYGRKYLGIVRSTFVLNADHKLVKEWRNVKVPGHVDEVLEFIANDLA